ncbi:MAG: copper amine oxidase N-terminal domain-containing protein [Peptostreptococcaceae bacterium]|nr:copper amine oxidase N-terminal domain-containing protein [Peptostreptococcaceae bacterium]
MKRKYLLIFTLAILMSTQMIFAQGSSRMMLNFGDNRLEVNTVIRNGISLMEVRSFTNAMDLDLEFSKKTKSVQISDGEKGKSLVLYANSKRATITQEGMSKNLSSNYKTTVIEGRTYVPARFLLESLGYDIVLKDKEYYVTEKGVLQLSHESNKNAPQRPYTGSDVKKVTLTVKYGTDKKALKEEFDIDAIRPKNGGPLMVSASQFAAHFGLDYKQDSPKYGIAKMNITNVVGDKKIIIYFVEGEDRYIRAVGDKETAVKIKQAPAFVDLNLYVSVNDLTDSLELPVQDRNADNILEPR